MVACLDLYIQHNPTYNQNNFFLRLNAYIINQYKDSKLDLLSTEVALSSPCIDD